MGLSSIDPEHCFDLAETLHSGQAFQWLPHRHEGIDGFAACIGELGPIWLAQPSARQVLLRETDEALARTYLGLDHDMPAIQRTFPADDFMTSALDFSPGLRILRQPLWECLATFITSSLKQVAHISAISLELRRRFGERRDFDGQPFFTYPSPAALADAGEEALRDCALGYRAKSLHRAAVAAVDGTFPLVDLETRQSREDHERLRQALLELHGVGEKIANCVLLFSGGYWETFPIDVWIERILRTVYRKRLKGARLQEWANQYFGVNAGYAQQYLFHFARKTL
ncbi:MAG: DNA glycosylase [Verrucomicrobiota bacterium]